MGVYDLNNIQYLEYDFNDILNRIDQIYTIDLTDDKITLQPKLTATPDPFWASEENSEDFNKHIPTFKNLHTDMYAYVESIANNELAKYDYQHFEEKYENFKEFRLLNNLIKHSNQKNVEITFTKIVQINSKQFDLMCNFKYPNHFKALMYPEFIVLFLEILKDFKIISLEA